MKPHHKVTIGSFGKHMDAENVLSELKHAGYGHSDISVVLKDVITPNSPDLTATVIAVLSPTDESSTIIQLFKDNNASDTRIINPSDLTNDLYEHLHIYDEDAEESIQQDRSSQKNHIDRRPTHHRTGMYAHSK